MNEERLKEMRNLLVLNPDDELSDFLTHTDLIDLIDELLSLRTGEEVEEIVAEFQFRSDMPMNNHAFERMEKLARTFYTRNAEIVGLLNQFLSKYHIDLHGLSNRGDSIATRILEIVAASDGKSESEVGR